MCRSEMAQMQDSEHFRLSDKYHGEVCVRHSAACVTLKDDSNETTMTTTTTTTTTTKTNQRQQ